MRNSEKVVAQEWKPGFLAPHPMPFPFLLRKLCAPTTAVTVEGAGVDAKKWKEAFKLILLDHVYWHLFLFHILMILQFSLFLISLF